MFDYHFVWALMAVRQSTDHFVIVSSAQASIRAKLKHISQRSEKIETNQDSLSNGE